MFNAQELFKQRFSNHTKEMSRYLKYIFNGHLMIAMLFFIVVMATYYQRLLAELPENFPAAIVIGIAFGLVVSYSPVRTFLKEPDLVFVMPAEHKMGRYFRNCLIYSFVLQLYQVILVAAVLGPLYLNVYDSREGKIYLLTTLLLVIFKGWNMLVQWWTSYVRNVSYQRSILFVRVLFNILIFYFVVELEVLYALIGTILFVLLMIYTFQQAKKQDGLAWDKLIDRDLKSLQSFYRFANMFTEVPHIKSPMKRRAWLVRLITKIPMDQSQTYTYLYRLSFARSGDYFGIYVRLLIIGGLAIYFVPNLWLKLGMVVLFLYLSSFQLMTLYDHYRTIIWVDLYPVEKKVRQQSLIKFLFQLSIVKTILFSLLFLIDELYVGFIYALGIGIAFTFFFVKGYVNKRILAK